MRKDTLNTPRSWRSFSIRIVYGCIGLAVVLALGVLLRQWSSGPVQHRRVARIMILPDTPPPPPKEEKRPEPPDEVKVQRPKPQETPEPPAERLKMEGPVGQEPSPFAAGQVQNEYSGGPTEPKIGRISNSAFSWYTGILKNKIEEALAKDKKLANGDYKVVVRFWVSRGGDVEKFEITGTTGDPATDAAIKVALQDLPPLGEIPPDDMPQPVTLRITARSTRTAG